MNWNISGSCCMASQEREIHLRPRDITHLPYEKVERGSVYPKSKCYRKLLMPPTTMVQLAMEIPSVPYCLKTLIRCIQYVLMNFYKDVHLRPMRTSPLKFLKKSCQMAFQVECVYSIVIELRQRYSVRFKFLCSTDIIKGSVLLQQGDAILNDRETWIR